MNKKNYFNGFNAKLALAAVALTSVMFTSCDEENFTVDPTKPTELADATAIIGATAYDAKTMNTIANATFSPACPITITTKGGVAATTQKITATAEGYFTQEQIANVPAVAQGQILYIPTVFYMSQYDVWTDAPVLSSTTKEVELKPYIVDMEGVKVGKVNTFKIPVKEGTKITNLEEVLKKIEDLTYADGKEDMSRAAASSRAVDEEAVMARVKESLTYLANSMKDFKDAVIEYTILVPDKTASIEINVTAIVKAGTITLNARENDLTWSVDAECETVESNNIEILFKDENGHAHSHAGHGLNSNAGGGAAGR